MYSIFDRIGGAGARSGVLRLRRNLHAPRFCLGSGVVLSNRGVGQALNGGRSKGEEATVVEEAWGHEGVVS